jgi:hypothetical protein
MLSRKHVLSGMEFPFSIYVYQAPLRPGGKAHWDEVLRANNQQWAIYAAGLLHNAGVPHQDTVRERPVIKAVRYGLTFLALPDEKTVELCERVIAKQERRKQMDCKYLVHLPKNTDNPVCL